MNASVRKHLEGAAANFLRQLVPLVEQCCTAEGLSKREILYALPELWADVSVGNLLDLMKRCYVYQYPKADHTVDAVVFSVDTSTGTLKVLLIQRGNPDEPFYDCWALPGGFLDMQEDNKEAALRELVEETKVMPPYIEELATFSDPKRDPRGRVISTAYMTLLREGSVTAGAYDDAKDKGWFDVADLPELAFDHAHIIDVALKRLRSKVRWQPIGMDLLNEEFTLTELQTVYETILQRKLDKRGFRRRVQRFGVLVDTGKTKGKGHRPAKLYRFDTAAYLALQEEGINLEV